MASIVVYSCWSSLLQVCEVKIRERASHWWFHIHRVIKQFSDPEDGESANVTELINVLQQFMESSSLGEFSERLRMLVSFVNQTRTVDDMQGDNSSKRKCKRNSKNIYILKVHDYWRSGLGPR